MPERFGFNLLDILEEEPKAAFFGQQERFGRSPTQQQFWKGQFQDVHQEWLGRLGQQLLGGQEPNLRFTDFLKNFNFQQRFQSLPPSFRGAQTARFAPPTRFMF